jgi:hypothetical protein
MSPLSELAETQLRAAVLEEAVVTGQQPRTPCRELREPAAEEAAVRPMDKAVK